MQSRHNAQLQALQDTILNKIRLLRNMSDLHTVGLTRAHLEKLLLQLTESPASLVDPAFIMNEALQLYLSQHTRLNKTIQLWIIVACAACNKAAFEKLKLNLISCFASNNALLLSDSIFICPTMVRIVYASESDKIINLYQLHGLARPQAHAYHGKRLPPALDKHTQAVDQTVQEFAERSSNYDELECLVIKMQRNYRSKQRRTFEIKRLSALYSDWQERKEHYLENGSELYKPQLCNEILARRIMLAAAKVICFTEVNHYTSDKHLRSICDDGLYGRRSLRKGYYEFEPASLQDIDVENGDDNSICFGPRIVDTLATSKGICIKFKLSKLMHKNPCVFYKQKDFGMAFDRVRSVQLGNRSLHFSHTNLSEKNNDPTATLFLLVENMPHLGWGHHGNHFIDADITASSIVENIELISYNQKDIQAILTLNFFRFIDKLTTPDGNPAVDIIQTIYADIEALSEDELMIFMQNIGRNLTDTTEVNIYGSHLIDFTSIDSISCLEKLEEADEIHENPRALYTLVIADLIKSLNAGDMDSFDSAKQHLPKLFTSYRFLDFLISVTSKVSALRELHSLRDVCVSPRWKLFSLPTLFSSTESVDNDSHESYICQHYDK